MDTLFEKTRKEIEEREKIRKEEKQKKILEAEAKKQEMNLPKKIQRS